jgi:hypothetical protein
MYTYIFEKKKKYSTWELMCLILLAMNPTLAVRNNPETRVSHGLNRVVASKKMKCVSFWSCLGEIRTHIFLLQYSETDSWGHFVYFSQWNLTLVNQTLKWRVASFRGRRLMPCSCFASHNFLCLFFRVLLLVYLCVGTVPRTGALWLTE